MSVSALRRLGCALALCGTGAVLAASPLADFWAKLTEPRLAVQFACPLDGQTADGSLVWKYDGTRVTDGVDAVSGASRAHSTARLGALYRDEKKRRQLPAGLYRLLCFAVTDPGTAAGDGLTVAERPDGSLVIAFVHREHAYRIVTEPDGTLSLSFPERSAESALVAPAPGTVFGEEVPLDEGAVEAPSAGEGNWEGRNVTEGGELPVPPSPDAEEAPSAPEPERAAPAGAGFFVAKDVASQDDNGAFVPREEYRMASGEDAPPALDWDALPFEADCADGGAEYVFCGTLRATYADGTLRLTGTLRKKAVAIYRRK